MSFDGIKRLLGFQPSLESEDRTKRDTETVRLVGRKKDANLVLSLTNHAGIHMPAIDIDGIPVRVVESSTPGNCHLFIDKPMSWQQYQNILRALAVAGVIEKGYFDHSVRRGFSALRTGKRKRPRVHADGDYPTEPVPPDPWLAF